MRFIKTKFKMTLGVILFSVIPLHAHALLMDIEWAGANGYSLTGQFSYSDSLIGTGAIDRTSLDTFEITGFHNDVEIGSWDYIADGLDAGYLFNFNFDTTLETFLVGGDSYSSNGQLWNTTSGASTCNTFGFGSGRTAQAVCVEGRLVGSSFLSNYGGALVA